MHRSVPRNIRVLIGLVLVSAAAVVAVAAVHSEQQSSAPLEPVPAQRPAIPDITTARYLFDGADTAAWSDTSGNGHALTPVTGNDARAVQVPGATGQAVGFPPPCDNGDRCPRLALRAPSADTLNPGARPLRFGASLRLEPEHTSSGQNILQKGFSAEGSQYKLQIDGDAGQPSCVLVGDTDPVIHRAVADISVADGSWHTLECRRDGAALSLLVDGTAHAQVSVPASLSVTNDEPLSVGAKGAYGDNDQFHGLLDDVWIAIG